MKLAEEEDLWIGDSGASSHMMGSEEHVFNKKLISGSMKTANSAYMKMLHEGDINVDVGSTQVPFLMCTLEIPQKLQHKFFALNFCYLYF